MRIVRPENRIDYVEIPVTDCNRRAHFSKAMFGWEFQEWGDEYFSFNDGRFMVASATADEPAPSTGVLLVFLQRGPRTRRQRVSKELGGTISQEIFSFPGGRRFHFIDPVGTEFAIWGEDDE